MVQSAQIKYPSAREAELATKKIIKRTSHKGIDEGEQTAVRATQTMFAMAVFIEGPQFLWSIFDLEGCGKSDADYVRLVFHDGLRIRWSPLVWRASGIVNIK